MYSLKRKGMCEEDCILSWRPLSSLATAKEAGARVPGPGLSVEEALQRARASDFQTLQAARAPSGVSQFHSVTLFKWFRVESGGRGAREGLSAGTSGLAK